MAVRCYRSDEFADVIIYEFIGKWTWPEFHEVNGNCHDWIAFAEQPVTILLNFERGKHLPANSPREIYQLERRRDQNIKLVIVVGVFPALAVVGRVMGRLFPKRARRRRVFRTLKEGIAFLRIHNAENGHKDKQPL